MNNPPASPALTPTSTSILIVDDNPTNLKVLYDYLTEQNHRILVAEDGETAIEQAEYSLPDLILLDVMMPGIDGFETCRRLKQMETTRDIPVVFMTALADTPFLLKGFAVGAVDYLTKPLHQEEVQVRVQNHIQTRRLQKELQAEIRTRREAEEELRRINEGKDKFFNVIAHDLRTPIHGAVFFSESLLEAVRTKKDAQLEEIAQVVHESTSAVGRLLLDLLAWAETQMERVQTRPEQAELGELLKLNHVLAQIVARQKKIVLVNKAQSPIPIHADPRMVDTVVRNLLGNALKFTQPGGRVEIAAHAGPREITVAITDSGIGIAPERLPNLFQIGQNQSTYGTTGETGSGLGLPLCREMVEKNGGRLWVESELGKGSTFSFTVPTSASAAESPVR
jgi:signal transduction histidine kinase